MPQRKKKPITVGKRTSYMTGKRPVSAKPSQASKVRAAKKTTSSKYRSRRQKASKAKVTTGGQGAPGSAKVTTGRGRTSPKLPKVPAKSKPSYKGKGATKPSAAKLAKQVAARKAARVAARAAARGAAICDRASQGTWIRVLGGDISGLWHGSAARRPVSYWLKRYP